MGIRAFACALLLAQGLLPPGPLGAEPSRPAAPASPQQRFDPDLRTCQPAVIEAAHLHGLDPYRDQPEAVLARLAVLRNQLTRGTIERCLARGLISADQARQLQQGLSPTAGVDDRPASPPAPQDSSRP